VAVPAVVLPGLLMSHAALPAPSYLATQVVASGLSKGAISTSVCAVLREAIVEPLWRRMGKTFVRVTARTAVVAIVVGFGLYLWPKPARSQPSAFAFDTGITMRTPVAPQPLEMEALASAPIYNNPPQPTIPSVIDVVSSKPVTVVAPPANPPATTNQPTPWAVDAKLDQTTPAFNSNAVVTQSDPQSTSSYESASPGWPRIQYRQVTLQYLARQRTLPTAYPTNLFLWAPAQSQPSIRVIGSGSSARPARKKQN
jgi:hypothetical protein